MNISVPRRKLYYYLAFALGVTSILLGNHLELLAERHYISTFPSQLGHVESCFWVAPGVVLTGLVILCVFGILTFRPGASQKYFPGLLKHWTIAFAVFALGLIAGGALLPVR